MPKTMPIATTSAKTSVATAYTCTRFTVLKAISHAHVRSTLKTPLGRSLVTHGAQNANPPERAAFVLALAQGKHRRRGRSLWHGILILGRNPHHEVPEPGNSRWILETTQRCEGRTAGNTIGLLRKPNGPVPGSPSFSPRRHRCRMTRGCVRHLREHPRGHSQVPGTH